MIYVAIAVVLVFALTSGAFLGPTIAAVGLAVLLFEFNGNFNVFASAILEHLQQFHIDCCAGIHAAR